MENENKKSDFLLPASILVAGILISGSVIYLVGSKNQVGVGANNNQLAAIGGDKKAPEISNRDVILGDPNAPVSVIEYGDYQCPFCGKFWNEVEPQLRENYIKTGKVKMVYRSFTFLGPESTAAAQAAECAKDQKQFWAFHDLVYKSEVKDGSENNGNLNRNLFLQLAADAKLDVKAFTECIDSNKYKDQVSRENEEARSAGVDSTPTVFINNQKIAGALPYSEFKSVIDNILKNK